MGRYRDDMTVSFLRWCSRRPWDWLMEFPYPDDSGSIYPPEIIVWNLMREIETADATRFFRWVTFRPREFKRPVETSYALVGGLGSGEWKYWAKRWAAMNGDAGIVGLKLWRNGLKKPPLRKIMQKLFRKDQFVDIEVRLGSHAYWPDRKLRVDEKGMPLDPLMLKALKTINKPKPRKPPRVKWQSLLE